MAQDVLEVDRDGGGVGTQVDEHAASAFLCLGEHAVGHCQRSQVHLGNGDASLVEALVQVAIERLAPENVEEIAFKARALNAYGVNLVLLVHLVFLCGGIQDFLLGVGHVAISIHQLVDHFRRDNRLLGHLLDNDVLHAADALTAYAYIDMGNLGFQRRLQLLHDVGQTHHGLVNVVDYTLAYARGGIFLNDSEDGNAAVEVLFSCNSGYLR